MLPFLIGAIAALTWMGGTMVAMAMTHPDATRNLVGITEDLAAAAGLLLLWFASTLAIGTLAGWLAT